MAANPNATPALPDLSQCEAEPIHLSGAIQPHGVLLALRGPDWRIVQTTATCRELLGIAAEDLLEQRLEQALGAALVSAVQDALAGYQAQPSAPYSFQWPSPLDARALTGYVHESDALVLLELEPEPPAGAVPEDLLALAVRGLNPIRAQKDLTAKLHSAAALLRDLTGYDRVMIYRLDPVDWHGEVVAESRRDALEPYLGLHYPASDIPVQARQLYLINRTRAIVDIDYVPVPLTPALNPVSGQPLDLSHSLLRSVSPVHVEYLRNMGVRATLTLSLYREDQLWGLIACHHQTPYLVSEKLRRVMDWMAQDLETQIQLAEDACHRRAEHDLKTCREHVVAAMRQGARLSALLEYPHQSDLLGAVGAEGVALIVGQQVHTGGETPDAARIAALAAELCARTSADKAPVFATDCLSDHLPDTQDLGATAAGLVFLRLTSAPDLALLWFRAEQVRHLSWGGDPNKPVTIETDGRISPRKSFAAWTQTVHLHSWRWSDEELASASELGAVMDIELRYQAEAARNQTQAELIDAKERAEAASRAKSEFLANMSHEVRTPLNGVMGYLQVMEMSNLDEEMAGYVKSAKASSQSLLTVINDILDFSKIEAGMLTIAREPFTLDALLEQIKAAFRPQVAAKGIALHCHIAREVPAELIGDAARLRQVLFNLVGNAVKFTDKGLVRLDARMLEPSDAGRLRLQFAVTDTGVGIAADRIDELFEPFTQVDSSSIRRFQGTGLGLSIVKRLVGLMDGQVAIESTLGQGTTVRFDIAVGMLAAEPTAREPAITEANITESVTTEPTIPGLAQATPQSAEPSSTKRLRIMIVEDDPTSSQIMAMLLERWGHRVCTAFNGLQALEGLSKQAFDLVFMDVQMPEMDGIAATRHIRENRNGDIDPSVTIIAMTAHALKGDRETCLAAGMDDYLAKPVDAQALRVVLDRWAAEK
ncbi:response regulator [Thiorhodovibrio frisius]|uniref:Sensory/regulatory protein RpfC n=1 Tax=Thiorhodovibrio frisius TaxID=631362 RepID=H8Z6X2_9GAMM|nr:response regulator [Thiorhodovibrio frisius]EIC19757.1 bacteriophytochrome (light-regulated signal transduction histidine kinase) [Thiorhodovibrio frisius]WPL20274.1 Phytochrome-like protein cph1 [Thiorhodovibrio frisius]